MPPTKTTTIKNPVSVTPAKTPTPAPTARAPGAVEVKSTPGMPQVTFTHEQIALAAYFRWQRFGGDERTNWVEAERELREDAVKTAQAR